MFASVLIRVLLVIGLTLLPVILVNLGMLQAIAGDLTDGPHRDKALREMQGTRYGFVISGGCVALAIMLTVVSY